MELESKSEIAVTSWLVGEEIDVSSLMRGALARAPVTIRLGEGIAVVYRYGAVVLFGVEDEERRALFAQLVVSEPRPEEERDSALLALAMPGQKEGVDDEGTLRLDCFDLPRLRVVAEALARSAILVFYEAHLKGVLADITDPIARLRSKGRLPFRTGALLRNVGEVLTTEMRMVARAEVAEKPEFIWDEPDLDRLYTVLADEYELVDRDRAVGRKLDLVMRSVSVLMEALSARRSLHVEWAIFGLILAEIVLMA